MIEHDLIQHMHDFDQSKFFYIQEQLLFQNNQSCKFYHLHFAYHNHSFEFEKYNGTILFDEMLERCSDWQFIMDTYWVEFAGYSAVEYIGKIGGDRLPNIHFKDMAKDEKRSICSCGSGILDFQAIYEKCREVGVKNVFVEQDNAVEAEDPFGEMEKSFRHLRAIVK